jgi:hypothetical protein
VSRPAANEEATTTCVHVSIINRCGHSQPPTRLPLTPKRSVPRGQLDVIDSQFCAMRNSTIEILSITPECLRPHSRYPWSLWVALVVKIVFPRLGSSKHKIDSAAIGTTHYSKWQIIGGSLPAARKSLCDARVREQSSHLNTVRTGDVSERPTIYSGAIDRVPYGCASDLPPFRVLNH